MLILPPPLQRELIQHAREGVPSLVCGLLAGAGTRVTHVRRIRNAANEVDVGSHVFGNRSSELRATSSTLAFVMDPLDQLRAYDEIDGIGADLIGYYNSWILEEARPNKTSVRLATDLGAYFLYISLVRPEALQIRAWKILKQDPLDQFGETVEVPIRS